LKSIHLQFSLSGIKIKFSMTDYTELKICQNLQNGINPENYG